MTDFDVKAEVNAAQKTDEDLLEHLTWEREHLATLDRLGGLPGWTSTQQAIVRELEAEATKRGLI